MKISDVLASIDQGTIALPEFQRGYVWSRDQVRGVMQSLYRQYPVGTLLVWTTQSDVTELRGDQPPFGNMVQLLLDGQQRITSLYGIIRGAPPKFFQGNANAFANLYFDLRTETFEFYGPVKMKGDPRWISVTDLFQEGFGFTSRLNDLEDVGAEERTVYFERIGKLLAIQSIDLHVEEIIGVDKTVDVVVEIFNRVNSGGTKLSKGDLTLARICARWPQARDQMNESLEKWSEAGLQFKLDWLLRVANAVLTGKADFAALDDVDTGSFKEALARAEGAVDTLINLTGSRLGLDHDQVLTGRYTFPVMAQYLNEHPKGSVTQRDQEQLLFWYVQCFLWGRHSSSVESTLQQDLDALQRGGLKGLIDLLELSRGDLRVRAEHFAVSERGARFYPFLYMLSRVGATKDLLTGIELRKGLLGKLSRLELHHIFPRAVLKKHGYQRAERNSLANFAFLMQESNLAISARLPSEYLAECLAARPDALRSQWIPEDPDLWTVENYPKFLERRRELLAQAANEFLDTLRAGEGPSADQVVPAGTVSVLSGDELLIDEIVGIVRGVGLASPELDFEVIDDTSGEVQAQADAAWPRGMQEELSEPVAFLVERDEDMEGRLGALGYRFFSSVTAFRHYVEELTATDIDGDGIIGAPAGERAASGPDAAVWQLVLQASPPAALPFHEIYLHRCIEQLGLDLRLPRTGDPRYVNLFPAGRRWGRVASLRPKSGRTAVFIDPRLVSGYEHAEVVYNHDRPVYMRVYLTSPAAVDDAIAITSLALNGEPPPSDRSDDGDLPEVTSPRMSPENQFEAALSDAIQECKRIGYRPTYFVQMVHDRGGVEAARHLINAPNISDGFTTLWERKRLDLSVEAIALRSEFATLFTQRELDQARRRLADFGFAP